MDTKVKIRELVPDAPENFGLAVVLRAIQKHKGEFVDHDDEKSVSEGIDDLNETSLTLLGFWNLAKDNYDDQIKETQDFIGQLLQIN